MISKRLVVGFSVVLLGVASIADAQSSSRSKGSNSKGSDSKSSATSFVSGAPADSSDSVSFINEVAPIINAKCGKCHVRSAKGRYDIKSYDALMNSNSVEPNQPGDSHFIEVIESGEMPKGGLKVTDGELATLKKWIEEGAIFDGDDKDASQAVSSMGKASDGNSRDGGSRSARGNAARGTQDGAARGRSNGRRSGARRSTSSRASAFDSNALLKFLDSDGNGELSLKEIDAAKRLLYSLDVNEDDRLTGDEVNDLRNK